MKRLLCLFNCLTAVFCASSQSLPYANSPLFTGNGAYSENFKDAFSFVVNTASLAGSTGTTAGVYAGNKFGLKELNHYIAVLRTGINEKDGIAAVLSYSGTTGFNQSLVGIAYGKNIGRINIGVRFNYSMMRAAGFGSSGVFTYELGSTWKITEKFISGIQISNPQGGKFAKDGTEKLPAVFSAGAGYECSEQLLITVSIIKEESRPVNVQAGIQYIIAKSLYTALGMSSATSSPSMMLGWQWKGMRIAVSGSYHPQLGATTGIGIIFFGKNKKEEP